MPNYLALDIGTKTGVAFTLDNTIRINNWNLCPVRGRGGTWPMAGRFTKFREQLEKQYRIAAPDRVFFEEVHAHKGTRAAHIYGGLVAVLAMWAESHSVTLEGVGVGTIKRRVTGKGNASKQEVMTACRARGYSPATFDEADALALLLGVLDCESIVDSTINVVGKGIH